MIFDKFYAVRSGYKLYKRNLSAILTFFRQALQLRFGYLSPSKRPIPLSTYRVVDCLLNPVLSRFLLSLQYIQILLRSARCKLLPSRTCPSGHVSWIVAPHVEIGAVSPKRGTTADRPIGVGSAICTRRSTWSRAETSGYLRIHSLSCLGALASGVV